VVAMVVGVVVALFVGVVVADIVLELSYYYYNIEKFPIKP